MAAFQRWHAPMSLVRSLVLLLCVGLAFDARSGEAVRASPTRLSEVQQVTLGGRALRYRVSFDTLALEDGGDQSASISAIGYLAEGADPARRPVLFAFNGGPGASAVLQVEGLGPLLRVREGQRQVLLANPDSALDLADLVFIDPPGTGFSRAPSDAAARARLWSDRGDAEAVEAMIRAWLKTHRRTRAPLYIAGESYGGYRLARLCANIADLHPAGVVLVSPLLDATGTDENPGNDLRAIFELPSLAVAAAVHGKGTLAGQPAPQVYAQARQFALTDYAAALLQGSALPAPARAAMAERLSALLGLPAVALQAAQLRPGVEAFRQSLLAGEGRQIGRLDSRVVAPLPAPAATADAPRPSAANDPALGLGRGNRIASALMAEHLRGLFGPALAGDYVSLDIGIAMAWRFSPDDGTPDPAAARRFDPTPHLARLAAADPGFRVLLLTGYYDLAVPALAPSYALHHAGLDPARIDERLLPAGHAVFAEAALRAPLHDALHDFLK